MALAVLGLGTMPVPLDTSVNIALPSLAAGLGLDIGGVKWIVIAYVLTYSSLLLVFGRLGDVAGYRRVLQAGLLLSALGLAAGGLAVDLTTLLAARALQGIGTALTLACGPAIATSLYPDRERTRALAIYASIIALGAALGPILGGLVLEQWGWPGIFAARAPLAAMALLLSPLIPQTPVRGEAGRLDLVGAVLLILSMALAALSLGGTLGAWTPLVAAGALALGATWLLHALAARQPIIDPRYFRDPPFAVLNAASIAIHLACFSVLLIVPFFLATTAGLGQRLGGLVLAMSGVGAIIGSTVAGRIVPRLGAGRTAFCGLLIAALALISIAFWRTGTPVVLMMAALAVQGLGLGLYQVAATDIVTATLPVGARGVAGSLTMVMRTIGVVSGASLLATLHRRFQSTCVDLVIVEGCTGAVTDPARGAPFALTLLAAGVGLLAFALLTLLVPRAWSTRT